MKVKEGQAFVPKSAWPDYEPPPGAKGWIGEVIAIRKDRVQLEFEDGSEYWFDRAMVEDEWNKGVPVVVATRNDKPDAKKATKAAAEKPAAEKAVPKFPTKEKPVESPTKAKKPAAAAAPAAGKRKVKAATPEPAPKRPKEAAPPPAKLQSPEKERKQAEKERKREEKERKALVKDIKAALPEASLEALKKAFAVLHE